MEILKKFKSGSVLALVEIDKIKGHEDIKEDYLAELTKKIGEDGELRRPILVAKDELVVLDGHHRLLACKNLGCRQIPTFLVDYFRPDIRVEFWTPLILEEVEAKNVFQTLKDKGFSVKQVDSEETLQPKLDAREVALGLITHDSPLKYFIVKSEGEVMKKFSIAMKAIIADLHSRQKLSALKYLKDINEAKEMIEKGEAHMLIRVPHIAKENVIKRGNIPQKYPPKTTRHIVQEYIDLPDYAVSLERLKK